MRAVPLDRRQVLRPGHRQAARWLGEHRSERWAIVALSPALDADTKAEFKTWGPGKYDPRHHAFDGINILPLKARRCRL